METIDPATGKALPPDAIQRVLFVGGGVHVYQIPPETPGRGHVAASWTADGNRRQIFTARVRVIETSTGEGEGEAGGGGGGGGGIKADVVLEDPSTGQLFAAAPYVARAVVEPVSDSSRFFALRVQDPAGRKATLGVGFEERSEAFDFGVALQEAQKALAWAQQQQPGVGGGGGAGKPTLARTDSAEQKRDLSLKEGETITVNLPGRMGRRKQGGTGEPPPPHGADLSSFSLPPPPSAGSSILPPPPAPQHSRAKQPSAAELGFDDGKFGEFA
ncbi:hypothetical protein GGR56DRAFT_353006 [Xylariaceae sp. FL0804]|nr:hypothetical protein GGR56DRAFT_353006 [Xylariaceae sp. FL0804]